MDEEIELTLPSIRESLMRQEDSIIYNLLERAQYRINPPTYDANGFTIPGFEGSLVEYMLRETERLHAKVGVASLSDRQDERVLRGLLCEEAFFFFDLSSTISLIACRTMFLMRFVGYPYVTGTKVHQPR